MNSPSPEPIPFLDLVLRRALRCAAYLAGTAAALVVFLAFYVAVPDVRAIAQPTPARCAALQTGSTKDYAECMTMLKQNTALAQADDDKHPLSMRDLVNYVLNLLLDGFFGLLAVIRVYALLSLALGFLWAAFERLGPPVTAAWRRHRLEQEKCS